MCIRIGEALGQQLGTRVDAETLVQRFNVIVNRVNAESKLVGYLLLRIAGYEARERLLQSR